MLDVLSKKKLIKQKLVQELEEKVESELCGGEKFLYLGRTMKSHFESESQVLTAQFLMYIETHRMMYK